MSHVTEAIASAAVLDHAWDRQALDWPLTHKSTVVEIGGYKGRWALQIAERYNPRLYVFEPQAWAADVAREVLEGRAFVYTYALGIEDAILPMGEFETDGCSFLKSGPNQGQMREMGDVFAELGLATIDLMLMNIEGYEYTLIPHMLKKAIYPTRLMVQFHTFADPDERKRERIDQMLGANGYGVAWSYGNVLTAWERENTCQ